MSVLHLFENRYKLVILIGMLSATIFSASAALSETKTVQSGNVQAELSYHKQDESYPKFTQLHLKIIRAGQTVLDQALPESEGSWPGVAFASDSDKEKSFQIRDLDADREPEILVDMFTGGAHCCNYTLIYRYMPATKHYTYLNHAWGDVNYTLKGLGNNNLPKFVSNDDRFAYAFGSFAGSGFPLQIWQYRQGKMQDVTRQYPKLVYNDAYYWWQTYLKNRQGDTVEYGKGPLAAYLADKYLLGQGQDGWRQLEQVYQGSDRQQYFKQLRKFLQTNGYIQ